MPIPRSALPVTACIVAVTLPLALASCGTDRQSAVNPSSSTASPNTNAAALNTPLTVPEPPLTSTPAPDCLAAKRIHNNHNNVCATWENNAKNFTAPATLSTNPSNFTLAAFDAGGTSTHHANATPGTFGDWTWGATSASQFYDASMSWQFNSAEPADTVNGNAVQEYNAPVGSSCSTGQQYLSCFVTKAEVIDPFDTERLYKVTYGLFNAPLTVQIRNNTGKTMTRQGTPTTSFVRDSAAGTGGTETIPPAVAGTAEAATYGMYRSTSGQPASFQVVYKFPDANFPDQTTHYATVTVDMTPSAVGDARNWTVNTSKTNCVDNPIGGSSPQKVPLVPERGPDGGRFEPLGPLAIGGDHCHRTTSAPRWAASAQMWSRTTGRPSLRVWSGR